jgi:6-phosphogluconolactonase
LKNSVAQPKIILCPTKQWASLTARYVQAVVSEMSSLGERCSVMLTGGRSAGRLMSAWAELPPFAELRNVDFLFGDERCVPPEDSESNFGLAMRTLFRFGVPKGCIVHRIEAESKDKDSAAKRYSELLPDRISLLLLSLGEDAHIASLFPNDPMLYETQRKIVPVIGPKPPYHRLTITPSVIQAAKKVHVLAIGDEKRRKYEEALIDPENIGSIPARLVLNRTWIFDLDEEIVLCPKR